MKQKKNQKNRIIKIIKIHNNLNQQVVVFNLQMNIFKIFKKNY